MLLKKNKKLRKIQNLFKKSMKNIKLNQEIK